MQENRTYSELLYDIYNFNAHVHTEMIEKQTAENSSQNLFNNNTNMGLGFLFQKQHTGKQKIFGASP